MLLVLLTTRPHSSIVGMLGKGQQLAAACAAAGDLISSDACSCSYTPTLAAGPFAAVYGQQVRTATKKSGGSASQKSAPRPSNLGVKMTAGELIFPGQIIVRQRGTKFHPGYNVSMGRDYTIFSTAVGFVNFREETLALGPDGRLSKQRRYISVEPVNEDWDPKTRAALEADLIKQRAAVKRQMLRGQVFEPALYFSKRRAPGQPFSWLTRPEARLVDNSQAKAKGQDQ